MKIRCYGCDQKLDVSEVDPLETIPCPVCETSLIVPMPFGEFLLEEEVGQGTLATVYRAMDLTLDREIGLKVLKPVFQAQDDINTAFIKQARMTSAINHPQVIPIYSCGEHEEQTYIVMQYMSGSSLKFQIDARQEPPTWEEAAPWLRDAARGLESARVHGIIHGDVKPSNILMDLDGHIKIADFGLSRLVFPGIPIDFKSDDFEMTLVRSQYISPEQITSGTQDGMGDIYGLGASFYHLLSGQPPFTSEDPRENIRRRFQGKPRDLSVVNPSVPEDVNELIMAMLSVYPSDRPSSYADIIRSVQQIADSGSGTKATKPKKKSSGKTSPKPKAKSPIKAPKQPSDPAPAPAADASAPADTAAPEPEDDAPVYYGPPRAGALVWLCRIVFSLAAIVLITLGMAHAIHAQWYDTHVKPRLPSVEAIQPPEPLLEPFSGSENMP